MHRWTLLITTIAALVLSGRAAGFQKAADLIFFNARVHTVDENKPRASAFAVQDGKFIAVSRRRRTKTPASTPRRPRRRG